VVDPVMIAKSGAALLDEDAVAALRQELLPRALVVTPNIPEAEALSGRSISSLDGRKDAARRIHEFGPSAVVIKGGHGGGSELVDLLFDGRASTSSGLNASIPGTLWNRVHVRVCGGGSPGAR
jgi:hydroxymethylpyrimidine/phosphomethylpyrimidine kinase